MEFVTNPAAAFSSEDEQNAMVSTLDAVVSSFYDPRSPDREAASEIMLGLRQHPMGWMRVDTILERSSQDSTRYFALSILEDAIKLRWREMPPDQREGVKNFVMTKCIELSETQESLAANSRFLQKLNLVLVQILKHEWPHNWPTFIPDICGASQSRPSWCENNMHILLLLSEEIFEFSKEEITSEKALRLKERLDAEFEQIFKLCEFILRSDGVAESLLIVTLKTIIRFIVWIRLGYLFETDLARVVVNRMLPVPALRNQAMAVLCEIAGLTSGTEAYHTELTVIYSETMSQLVGVISPDMDLKEAYDVMDGHDGEFIQRLGLFLTNFYKPFACTRGSEPRGTLANWHDLPYSNFTCE